jgi:hypothetical protein
MATFEDFIAKTSSEKVTLVHLGATRKELAWTLVSGTIYKKTTTFFATLASFNGTDLSEAASSSVASNEFFFDPQTAELFVDVGADPASGDLVATYKLFFATGGFSLPHDLNTGSEVPYLAYVEGSSKYKSNLDHQDLTGISISGQMDVKLKNTDGYFDTFYDHYNFENQTIKIFSWSPDLAATEAKLIYEGKIDSKSFGENSVSFKGKDLITNLKNKVPLGVIQSTDGTFSDDIVGKVKRRIYGKVDHLQLISFSMALESVPLTGTISGTIATKSIVGTGSAFLTELKKGDILKYVDPITLEEIELNIDSITSDTALTITEDLEATITNQAVTYNPVRGTKNVNRTWFIAGHALKEESTTITSVGADDRFIVADSGIIEAGDLITIAGQKRTVKRVNAGNEIVLNFNMSPSPAISDSVTLEPVQQVYADTKIIRSADFSVTNISGKSELVLSADAELNATVAKVGTGNISMTTSSRAVTGSGTKFTTELRAGDWIKADGDATGSNSGYYEILQINSDTSLDLVVAKSSPNVTNQTFTQKNVDYLKDDSIVSANVYGKTKNGLKTGAWIKTASEVIEDLVIDAGLASKINTSAFFEASNDAPFTMSMAIPKEYASETEPEIKESINKVNTSIFGSLHLNSDFEFVYTVLTSKKPSTMIDVRDDSVINWSIQSDGKNIVREVLTRYRFQDVDRFGNNDVHKIATDSSLYVDRLIGTKRKLERDLYLYDDNDAKVITQRIRFLAETANSIITMNTKLEFIRKTLNDKVRIEFDRLFERLGGNQRSKIGLIQSISKNPDGVSLSITDLTNMFNRVCNITANTADTFSSASDYQKSFNGYICDNTTGIVDTADQDTYGINLIG